jgi:tetrathionate reductase subunit B
MSACPFAVIRFNTEKNVAEKCTLCIHRIKKGLKPACVQHCEAGAIFFGDINEITELMMKERLRKRVMKCDNAGGGRDWGS